MDAHSDVPNVYADTAYAGEYAELGWNKTYYLIKRDLPGILKTHVAGTAALDFGCGTGRSTRLLRECGFNVVGIDVSEAMVKRARGLDPGQDYRVIADGDFSSLISASFDLVLSCFPFDNISGDHRKRTLLRGLAGLLKPTGCLVNIVSSADLYVNEWASFTTARFPNNRTAKSGEVVQVVTTEFSEARVCDDVLCDDATYMDIYGSAGLQVEASYRPLGRPDDGIPWISELTLAPWVIWVLKLNSR